jgi:beta-galactosidase/beta-glucuronidase
MEVRPEYPRPQWRRERWQSLNGAWEFEIDQSDTGLQRGLRTAPYGREIRVPFAPESELSGIANTDFMDAVWYRREVTVDPGWVGERILLHFQAVDHDTTVWVNDVEVGRHRGGSTPFAFDITEALDGDRATVVVRARDPRTGVQARGKQATWYENTGCYYTRTTGIWQTVWLEPVGRSYLKRPRITPDVTNSRFVVSTPIDNPRRGQRLTVELTDADGVVASEEVAIGTDFTPTSVLTVPADRRRLWCPDDPHLYGLRFVLADGGVIDEVESYAGLRSVAIEGNKVLLNGEPFFQRLVLDQGYWPDGLMTAPSDSSLVRDIELGLAAGFNGARLHQKVFEERYLHHADRLGYLVWGEFPDWGAQGQGSRGNNQQPTTAYVAEWQDVVARDYNHPSIIGWCPLNETHQDLHDRETQLDDVTRAMFRAAKTADPTRPVIDASGYSHRVPETDIWDSHSYEQDPEAFARQLAGLAKGEPFGNVSREGAPQSFPYGGQPYMVSEYGGIWWNAEAAEASGTDRRESWGYGQRVGSLEEFYERFEGLTRVLLEDPDMFGYCYTQLTDVFQEQNGLYGFDRSEKFDIARIRAVQTSREVHP